MAIAREEPAFEDDSPVEAPMDDAGAVVSPLGAGGGKPKGRGGPRTAEGKRISSLNAMKNGIHSANPTVGDERLEDWEAHLTGLERSLEPEGYLEKSLVYTMARNRWQRNRLDRWNDDLVGQQIEGAALQSRDALELAHASLPEDEVVWSCYDAEAVLATLESMSEDGGAHEVGPDVAAGVLLAVGLALEQPGRATPTDALEQLLTPPDGSSTLDELRRRMEQVAQCLGSVYEIVLADTIAEADAAALHQTKRAQQDRHRQATRMASAFVLNDHDLAKFQRYGSQLEREFDRTLKQFETIQSARCGVPSPRLRVEVDGGND